MKSPVMKRSIVVAGHKTSVSLEEAFWNGMKEISGERNVTLSNWLARSTLGASRAICLRRSACSCSTTSRPVPRARLEAALHSSPSLRLWQNPFLSAKGNCQVSAGV